MRKFLGIALATAFAISAFGAPALGASPVKGPLYDSPSYTPGVTCPNGADDTSGPVFGFAVISNAANGQLQVQVSVKGGTPDSAYDIWVNQDPGACPLGAPTAPAALVTNANGNGNAHVVIDAVPGATAFWVSAVGGGQVLRSTAVPA